MKRRVNLGVSFARDAGVIRYACDAVAALRPIYEGLPPQEVFIVMSLNARGRPTRADVVGVGTLTATLVHPREVFAAAIVARAQAIIVAHNHPSGDATPSDEDIELAERLRAAGELMGIPVVDFLVLGDAWRSVP